MNRSFPDPAHHPPYLRADVADVMHAGLAVASLYFNVVAFWKEAKYMIENNMLMEEVDRLLR